MDTSDRHVGPATLAYAVSAFSLSSYLLLRAGHANMQIPLVHTLAYGLVIALFLLNVWQFVGWKDGPWGVYKTHAYVRTLVSFFCFPVALGAGIIVLHRMLDGTSPSGRAFWSLFAVLLTVAAWTGFIGVTEKPTRDWTDTEVGRAHEIKKHSWRALISIFVLVVGGGVFIDYLTSTFIEMQGDSHLTAAAILIALSAIVSFAIQPWLMARYIEVQVSTKTNATIKGR